MTAPSSNSNTSSKALIGLLLAGSIGVIIFLFVHLSSDSGAPTIGSKPASAACKGDKCLPDVNYIDTNGTAYTKQTLAGKVVIVNFWATWCKPCLKELPDLSKLSERHKGAGLVVLGVLASDNPDNATLLNFQSDNDMSFPVIRATSDILSAYDYPGSLPTTFIFDRNGRQAGMHIGALSLAKLTDLIEPLLAQK